MNDITGNSAAVILRHHELAALKAGQAVEHAREAGRLLLEAKSSMPHGAWLPWLTSKVGIPQRTAQRYMGAASGKSPGQRSIATSPPAAAKSAKLTYLPNPMPADWKPQPKFRPTEGMFHWGPSGAAGELWDMVLEPSLAHPGFWFVSRINADGDTYDCTSRPIHADWVEFMLVEVHAIADPSALPWQLRPCNGVSKAFEMFSMTEAA